MVDLTFSLLSRHFPVGGSFGFNVIIDGLDNVNAAAVNIVFDNSKLRLLDIEYVLSPFSLEAKTEIGDGFIKMARAIPGGAKVSGRSVFATLTFEGTAAGDARVDFSEGCQVIGFDSEADVLQNRIGAVFSFDSDDTLAPAEIRSMEALVEAKQVGSTVEVKFKEPVVNSDGSPLSDLGKSNIQIVNDSDPTVVVAEVDVPASAATGGADQTATLNVPVVGGVVQNLTITGIAVDLVGNKSTPVTAQLVIDTLAPGPLQ